MQFILNRYKFLSDEYLKYLKLVLIHTISRFLVISDVKITE
jgi:hypothetical protein